jgi:hypothetical protein
VLQPGCFFKYQQISGKCYVRRARYVATVTSWTLLQQIVFAINMEQSPIWKANSRSASQELPPLWRNMNVSCRGHKNPLLTRPEPDVRSTTHVPSALPSRLFANIFRFIFCVHLLSRTKISFVMGHEITLLPSEKPAAG